MNPSPEVALDSLLLLLLIFCNMRETRWLAFRRPDGYIGFAQAPERVSTKSFVILIIGNSKSNNLDAQGTFKPR